MGCSATMSFCAFSLCACVSGLSQAWVEVSKVIGVLPGRRLMAGLLGKEVTYVMVVSVCVRAALP
jgi:hypothetical protein